MTAEQQLGTWAEQAIRGDREAGGELLRHFYKPIFAYLRRLSGNDADAADLTQQTFSKVWRSLNKFRAASSLNTWVHRIAYCTYIDWVRQRDLGDDQPQEWWETLPATGPSPFESAAEADSARRLYLLVQGLEPESRRAAIHLHYYQNLSLPESAEVLRLPLSTLKYHLKAALDELRRRLPEPQQTLSPSEN